MKLLVRVAPVLIKYNLLFTMLHWVALWQWNCEERWNLQHPLKNMAFITKLEKQSWSKRKWPAKTKNKPAPSSFLSSLFSARHPVYKSFQDPENRLDESVKPDFSKWGVPFPKSRLVKAVFSAPEARVTSEEKSERARSKEGRPNGFLKFFVGGLPLLTTLVSGSLSSLSCLKFSKFFFASSCIDLA